MEFEKFLKKNWKSIAVVGAVVLVAYLIDRNAKKKKDLESKSDFIGSPFGKTVQFTLSNNSNSVQVVNLFDSYNLKQNPYVKINPNISFFNQTLPTEAKLIKSIQVRNVSGNNNLNAPINIVSKDANGEMNNEYLYPMLSPFQSQTNVVTVSPDNLIVNGQNYLQYTLQPNSSVSLVFMYDVVTSVTEMLKDDEKVKKVA